MHELSIASAVVDSVLEFVAERSVKRVISVKLAVGELTQVEEEQLRFSYMAITQETPIQDSELEIERVAAVVLCRECGYSGRPKYWDDALAVAPIHVGSGTRTKIIEAAMHAVPVVSTTIGAEGLSFQDGSEIIIADDPATFANGCLRLLADVKIRREIGHAARARALRDYTPERARERLLSICADVAADRESAPPCSA